MMEEVKVEDHLWDEYKLIQDKIDRIGEFRFKVKGWAVTLVSSLSVGASAASLPATYFLITIPIVVLFWILEEQQKELQKILIGRSLVIERVLPLSTRVSSAKEQGRLRTRLAGWTIKGLQASYRRRWFVRYADRLFYGLLLAVLVYVIILAASEGGRERWSLGQRDLFITSSPAQRSSHGQ